VDVLVILETPNMSSYTSRDFVTTDSREYQGVSYLIHRTLDEFLKAKKIIYPEIPLNINVDYAFAVSCVVDDTTPVEWRTAQNKPNSRLVHACNKHLFKTIREIDPKVIIAVGDLVTKALYIPFKKYNNVVSRSNNARILDRSYPVIPVLKAESIIKNDTNYSVSRYGVWTAFDKILGEYTQEKYNLDISKYRFPTTPQEVSDICDLIISEVSGDKKDFLSIDIETNSKYAYMADSKMISIGFSWGEGESCAFWYDSKHAPYKVEEIHGSIQRVLKCDARKVLHNASFDYKFLVYKHGFEIFNLCWDTLLAEHVLDENAKGFYNLEFLGGKYFPAFENYKKLALKKIGAKDATGHYGSTGGVVESLLSNGTEDSESSENEETSDAGTFILDNDAYQEAVKTYEEDLRRYQEQDLTYKKEKAIYEQELKCWQERSKSFYDLYAATPPKERKKLQDTKRQLDSEKPKRPTKGGAAKPVKPDIDKFGGEDTKDNYENYDPQDLMVYNAMDADITRRICVKQFHLIVKEDKRMLEIISKQHVPAIKALSAMEYYGVNTDQEYLNQIEKELSIKYDELLGKLCRLSNTENFKPNSPKQIGFTLHSVMGIPMEHSQTTASGQISVNVDALEKYKKVVKGVAGFEGAEEFIDTLLEYRDVSKALTTTVKNFRKYTAYDGKLRTNYHINGTATGRLSSSALNLQNIALIGGGVNLKKVLVPDEPRIKMISELDNPEVEGDPNVKVELDISNAEVRCFTSYAKEPSLIKAIREGLDTHCATASEVFLTKFPQYKTSEEFYKDLLEAHKTKEPTPFQQQLKTVRQHSKAVLFGILFGITKYGLSRDLKISEEEAQNIIDSFFIRYPKIKEYMDQVEIHLKRYKEVQSLTNRKRRFPRYDLNPHRCLRQGINFTVQNISSDLVVRILGGIHQSIKEELGGRVLLTVHDSILLSIPKSSLPKVEGYLHKRIVEYVRDNFPWMVLDFQYDWKWGCNYGEMTKWVPNA
jgi:DNA polymerase I-like protein with 3'-5' exonuclease and polymerase domains